MSAAVFGEGTHRSEGASAIYVMVDLASVDGDVGVAEHTSSGFAEYARAAADVAFHATAAAVHVASIHLWPVGTRAGVGLYHLGCRELGSDGAGVDLYVGVLFDVTVAAAAEHAGAHLRVVRTALGTYGDEGLVDIGHVAPRRASHTTS